MTKRNAHQRSKVNSQRSSYHRNVSFEQQHATVYQFYLSPIYKNARIDRAAPVLTVPATGKIIWPEVFIHEQQGSPAVENLKFFDVCHRFIAGKDLEGGVGTIRLFGPDHVRHVNIDVTVHFDGGACNRLTSFRRDDGH